MNRNIIFIHPLQEECDAFTRVCLENEYEVTAVSDGEEALAILRDQTFAIAVVSRRMKGEEVAHILTALEAHPETAIILGAAAISKSDLIYFFNRRKVYRIYLEPIDYRTEMLNILDAAMLDVEVKAANRQDQVVEEKQQMMDLLMDLMYSQVPKEDRKLMKDILEVFMNLCIHQPTYVLDGTKRLEENFRGRSKLDLQIDVQNNARNVLEQSGQERRKILFTFLCGLLGEGVLSCSSKKKGALRIMAENSRNGIHLIAQGHADATGIMVAEDILKQEKVKRIISSVLNNMTSQHKEDYTRSEDGLMRIRFDLIF